VIWKTIFSYFYKDFSRWPLWAPVFLGIGIAIYFSLPFEPSLLWSYSGISLFTLALWSIRLHLLRLLLLSVSIIALGFSAAALRTHWLSTPMLHASLPPLVVEGKVIQVEIKPTKKGLFFQKIFLSEPKADEGEILPDKIRVTLKGKRERLWPGQIIRLTAKISPISDASLPGEFDFRRHAYFQGIGATGFAFSPPHVIGNKPSFGTRLEKRREKITAFFLESLSFPEGAIAGALITGDKATIPEDIREEFVRSGLSHILAISGLHLTIIAGVIFMVIRRSLTLIPSIVLFYNIKKLSAIGTILMTFFYLVLSGFGIPAQRAFIMISLVMGAILMDRTALSMRTVAVAAFAILLTTPEALLGPSFQLSFAAVIGLIAGYEVWRNPLASWIVRGGIIRKCILYVGGTTFTSLLATCATLPFTVYIFHRFSLHAIEANLLAVPLVSLIIMPAAFLSCLLTPLGLGGWPLWVLEKSLHLLVKIASFFAYWPGANIQLPQPPLISFMCVVLGSLWLCLWQQPWRRWGIVPIFLGCFLAFFYNPPDLMVDGQGKIAAFYDPPILYVSSLRKGKFTAEMWGKHLAASQMKLLPCEEGVCELKIQGIPVVISFLKEKQPCIKGAVLIRLEPSRKACPEAHMTIDRYDLWRGGSHALWVKPQGIQVKKVRPHANHRPWERKAISRKRVIQRSRISPSSGVDPRQSL
jgi:competence protein ComEC